jgi:polysaccharide biosynthesis transport protein
MASEEASPVPHRDILAVLRLRKWSILCIAALTFAAGLFLSLRQTPVYEASTKILVKPFSSPLQSGSSILVDMPTEVQIVSSDQVLTLAVQKMSTTTSVPEAHGHLSVDNAASTNVLIIGYSNAVPLLAQQGAAAVGSAYLEYKTSQFRESVQTLEGPYLEEIDRITTKLTALNAKIQRSGGSATAAQQAQQVQLNTQLAVARSQLVPIEAIPLDPGDIIQVPALPQSPTSPKVAVNAAMALFVGVALGIGFAFLRDWFDDRVRSQEELEARAGAPVLALVPRAKGRRKRDQAMLVTRDAPSGPLAEAFRLLRTGLLFAATQHGCRTVLITSPSPGDGKSTISANLGVMLADAGKNVILVSADLRKPRLHRFFGVRDKPGLVDVLSHAVSAQVALTDSGIERLRLLPSGAMTSLHAELLASDAMGQLLRHRRLRIDRHTTCARGFRRTRPCSSYRLSGPRGRRSLVERRRSHAGQAAAGPGGREPLGLCAERVQPEEGGKPTVFLQVLLPVHPRAPRGRFERASPALRGNGEVSPRAEAGLNDEP